MAFEEVRKIKDRGFDALVDKDLHGYLEIFSVDVEYTQLNGKTIDKFELYKNTRRYIDDIFSIATDYEIEEHSLEDEIYFEIVNQRTSLLIRRLFFFLFEWKLTRTAKYWWKQENGEWKILAVEVIDETREMGKDIRFITSADAEVSHGEDWM